jgi:hypothetical protein
MLVVSLIGAFTTAVIAWICARFFSPEIMSYSIVGFNLMIGLPLTAYVFVRKRAEWHIDPSLLEPNEPTG